MHFVAQTSLPIAISHGEGCELIDTKGKHYLDFIGGWCVSAIGWGHPEITKAIVEEAKRATYVPPFLQFPPRESFAKKLIEIAPGDRLQKVFPVTSGSEAVDMAIKVVRAASGKDTILSIDDVYHGHTYGALSLGDAHKRVQGSIVPGFEYLPMPGRDAGVEEVLATLEHRIKRGDVAGFISEPVWTNAGAYVPPAEFYPAVQKLCRKHDVLFVMDEVATGFCHCGKLFASQLWDLSPDVLCIAKAFTGGFGTMGATLVSQDVYTKSEGIPSYSTFGWNALDFAATRANVEIILREKVWENAENIGTHLLKLLQPLEQLPIVREVRGIGLVIGIHLKDQCSEVQKQCAESGLILEIAGETLLLTPPCILTKTQAKQGADIIASVLKELSS